MFLVKGVLEICSKLTGEHPCRSVVSIKLLCNFIDITFRHGYSPVNLLYISRTPFPKNTSGWLLLRLHWNNCVDFSAHLTLYLRASSFKTTWGGGGRICDSQLWQFKWNCANVKYQQYFPITQIFYRIRTESCERKLKNFRKERKSAS